MAVGPWCGRRKGRDGGPIDWRLREEGNDQYVEVVDDFGDYDNDPYTERIEREPLNDEVQVAVIGGAGSVAC